MSDVTNPCAAIGPVINSFAIHLIESPASSEALSVDSLPLSVPVLELSLVAAGITRAVSMVNGALAISLSLDPVTDVLGAIFPSVGTDTMLFVVLPVAVEVVAVGPSHLALSGPHIVLPVAGVDLLVGVLHDTLTVLHAVAELSVVGSSALPGVGSVTMHVLADKFTIVNITVVPKNSCFAFSYIVIPNSTELGVVWVGDDTLAVSLIVLEGTDIAETLLGLEGSVTMSHIAEPLSVVVRPVHIVV